MKCCIEFDTSDQASYIPQVESLMAQMGIETQRVNVADIMHGVLAGADMLTFPGGLGAAEGMRQYGENFVKAVQFFVASGGGYLGVCVPPETLIFANPTVKPISEVKVGDKVLSHQGYQAITKVFTRPYIGDLIEIKTWGGETLSLTPGHPVYTLRYSRPIGQNHRFQKSISNGGPQWIEARNLRLGDYILLAFNNDVKDVEHINLGDYLTVPFIAKNGGICIAHEWHGHKRGYSTLRPSPASRIIKTIPVYADFLELAGLYLAEGCTTRHRIAFNFGKHEKDLIGHTTRLVANVFGKRVGIQQTRTSTVVRVNSSLLANLFSNLFGKGSKEKCLPHWMMLLPPLKQQSLLKGLIDGDGCRDDERERFSTRSIQLAYQVRAVLHRLGKPNSFCKSSDEIYNIEGRHGPSSTKFSIDRPSNPNRSYSYVKDGFAYLPIRQINPVPYNGKVFNLEVAQANSYTTVGGTVHNCGGAYASGVAVPGLFGLLSKQSLRLIDVDAENPPLIHFLADYVNMQKLGQRLFTSCDISAVSHPIIAGHEEERVQLVYSGGPILMYTGTSVIPLAYYYNGTLADVRGEVAVAVSQFGKGRVVISGPHPEAPEDLSVAVGEPCCRWLYEAMVQYCLEPAETLYFPVEVLPWKVEKPLPSPALPMALVGGLVVGGILTTRKKCG